MSAFAEARRPGGSREGYSGIQIALHWVIAALVLFQLLFGESMQRTIRAMAEGQQASAIDQQNATLHYWFGISILVLASLRLVMRLTLGAPPAPRDIPVWMAIASRITHWTFYVLLIGVPIFGLLAFYVGSPFGQIHSLAKPVFIVLISLHVAAVFFHEIWLKDGLLGRMIRPR